MKLETPHTTHRTVPVNCFGHGSRETASFEVADWDGFGINAVRGVVINSVCQTQREISLDALGDHARQVHVYGQERLRMIR